MRPFSQGVIVGKFSPLHRGHERLIRAALDRCQRLTVISYSRPQYAGCDADERERWLATLFPTVDRCVLDEKRIAALKAQGAQLPFLPDNSAAPEVHREFVGSICREVLGIRVDVVFTGECYGDDFAASLTAQARRLDASAPAIPHVRIDREAQPFSISATAIRQDVHSQREWLHPEVYASFVRRVCILGGESSGKTSLAQALAERMGSVWVAEYGRELWKERDGKLEYDDLLAIGARQIALEEAARRRAFRWLICDTSPLTTLLYCREMFGRADSWLEELAERSYDTTILCANDFPFVQDGTRRDVTFRDRQFQWYVQELNQRRVPYFTATGSLGERVAAAVKFLEGQPA